MGFHLSHRNSGITGACFRLWESSQYAVFAPTPRPDALSNLQCYMCNTLLSLGPSFLGMPCLFFYVAPQPLHQVNAPMANGADCLVAELLFNLAQQLQHSDTHAKLAWARTAGRRQEPCAWTHQHPR